MFFNLNTYNNKKSPSKNTNQIYIINYIDFKINLNPPIICLSSSKLNVKELFLLKCYQNWRVAVLQN